ncbi:MAG: DinB family protein [Chloroflexia bacterium]
MDFLATARRQMLAGQVNDARERLLAAFEDLSAEDMLEPGVKGNWSVRDVLNNIASWDRITAECFRVMLAGERHPLLDMDEESVARFEQENYEAGKDRMVVEAIQELHSSREELVDLLRDVSNEQMFAPAPGDEAADMSIAACLTVTVNMDEESAEAIERWREAHEK